MALNSFENFTNQEINGLRITGIARREPGGSVVWAGICTTCGTSGQTFPHEDLRHRNIRCKSSSCGKPVTTETRRTAVGAIAPLNLRNSRARQEFDNVESKPAVERPLVLFDPWAARRKLERQLGEF